MKAGIFSAEMAVGFGFGVEGAVAVEDLFAGDGGDAVAGDDDAGEVHGVGGGDGDDGGAVAGAGGAEGFDGFGEGVLFAAEAGDEAAAANLAAGFEAAEDVEEIAPFGGVGLAGEEVAEEDAVAGEELAGEGFEGGVGSAGLLDCPLSELGLGFFGVFRDSNPGLRIETLRQAQGRLWGTRICGGFVEEGPAAGGAAGGALAGGFGGGGFAAGIHAGAELVEAVGSGEACGGELPECVLGLVAGEVGDALDVVGEAGSALLEEGAELQGVGAEGGGEFFFFDALLGEGVGEPVGGLADVEGDGGGVGGDDAAGAGGFVGRRPGRMGGDAAPAYGSGEAEGVEPAGVVVGDAGGEKGALPLDGGGFEAFELAEGFEDAFFAGELGLGGEVLPVEEPAHVDGGGDGFDLLAEGGDGAAVDALEDAAFAPLDFVVGFVSVCWVFEGAAHEEALHLHGEEGLEDGGWVEVQRLGEGVGGGGAEDL